MRIKDLVSEAYEISHSKGFHDVPCTFGDRIALVHTELSEAMEAFRENNDEYTLNPFDPIYLSNVSGKLTREPGHYIPSGDGNDIWSPHKPEGVRAELADVVIRIADMCGVYGIDLEAAIREKLDYNKTRPYMHGGKKL